jgi:hypothetical protein
MESRVVLVNRQLTSEQMPSRTIQLCSRDEQSSMKQLQAERNLWPIIAAIAVFVIVVVGTIWSFEDPFPLHWDEA